MMKAFLKAEWRNLLMANFEADEGVLKKYLPYKTELDAFNGNYYLSIVGFLFKDTRVKGIALPFHRNFTEVNLRFYVRYRENNTWKRGVVFIRELVPKRLITFVANTLYKENYETLPMKRHWDFSDSGKIKIEYYWKAGSGWNHIKAAAEKEPAPVPEGSMEEFITEHYWGYAKVNNTKTIEYKVEHPRWKIHTVHDYSVLCNSTELFGQNFANMLKQVPKSVFLAEGSPISVMRKRILQL